MQFNYFGIFGPFGVIILIVPLLMFMMIIITGIKMCLAGSRAMRNFYIDAPDFVIPERYRGIYRHDGSEIRTVRLPNRCPSCGAPVEQEHVDWVGPLEAVCGYCGAPIKAQFERL